MTLLCWASAGEITTVWMPHLLGICCIVPYPGDRSRFFKKKLYSQCVIFFFLREKPSVCYRNYAFIAVPFVYREPVPCVISLYIMKVLCSLPVAEFVGTKTGISGPHGSPCAAHKFTRNITNSWTYRRAKTEYARRQVLQHEPESKMHEPGTLKRSCSLDTRSA